MKIFYDSSESGWRWRPLDGTTATAIDYLRRRLVANWSENERAVNANWRLTRRGGFGWIKGSHFSAFCSFVCGCVQYWFYFLKNSSLDERRGGGGRRSSEASCFVLLVLLVVLVVVWLFGFLVLLLSFPLLWVCKDPAGSPRLEGRANGIHSKKHHPNLFVLLQNPSNSIEIH